MPSIDIKCMGKREKSNYGWNELHPYSVYHLFINSYINRLYTASYIQMINNFSNSNLFTDDFINYLISN